MTWWVAQHLVTVAILVAAVHVVSALFKIGPVLRHALWVVVLLKLITPPVVVWPWAAPIAARSPRVEVIHGSLTTPDARAHLAEGTFEALPSRAVRETRSFASPGSVASPHAPTLSWHALTLLAWLTGTLVLATIQIVRARRIDQLVRAAAPAPSALAVAVSAMADRMALGPVRVHTSDLVDSPFVWTLGRPVLVWPATMARADEIGGTRALIAHELAHVTRRDHWVGWLEVVATCVWWWNPLMWHVRSELRENAELACDAWATSLVPQGRRALADALVTLSATPDTRTPAFSLHVIGQRRHLRRRLVMIMQSRVPLRVPRFALVLLVVTGALTLPAWAQRGPDAPAPAPGSVASTPSPVPAPPAPPTAAAPAVPVRPVAPARVPPQPPTPPRIDQSEAQPMTDFERKLKEATSRLAEVRQAAERQALRAEAQAVQAQLQAQNAAKQMAQLGTPTPFVFLSELPQEAQVLLDRFEESSTRMREDVEAKITAEKTAVIAALQKLQDEQARAGKLDEAIAIRDRIRALQHGPSTWFEPFRYALPKRVGTGTPSTPKNPQP